MEVGRIGPFDTLGNGAFHVASLCAVPRDDCFLTCSVVLELV
jgi:hypothetical protein